MSESYILTIEIHIFSVNTKKPFWVWLKLELKRDITINYRGYNVYDIKLFAGNSSTLSSIIGQYPINQYSSEVSVSEIYPNPSTGMINIDIANNSYPSSVVVYNLLGQEVFVGEKIILTQLKCLNLWNLSRS